MRTTLRVDGSDHGVARCWCAPPQEYLLTSSQGYHTGVMKPTLQRCSVEFGPRGPLKQWTGPTHAGTSRGRGQQQRNEWWPSLHRAAKQQPRSHPDATAHEAPHIRAAMPAARFGWNARLPSTAHCMNGIGTMRGDLCVHTYGGVYLASCLTAQSLQRCSDGQPTTAPQLKDRV